MIPTKKGAQVHTSPHRALMAEIDIMRVLITDDMLNQYLLPIVNANLAAAQKNEPVNIPLSTCNRRRDMVEVVCKVPTKEPTEDREGCTTGKQDEASLEGIDGSSLIQCNQPSTLSG